MKVSVCLTVFNEEESIVNLLRSLSMQSKKPDEVVIVDGGSTDNTISLMSGLKSEFNNNNIQFRILIDKGANIAKGRNIAIRNAVNRIIAQIDAGCIAKKDWLEKITDPFENKNVGLVAGFYEMKAKNSLQKALNTFHGIHPKKYNPKTFLPSARSVAFRKNVWEDIGGYWENLECAGEDTLFFYQAVKHNVKIVRVKEARVVWEETQNMGIIKSVKKFYSYAKGDAQTGIWWNPRKQHASHNIKISLIFIRYLLGLLLLLYSLINPNLLFLPVLLIFLYINWVFKKVYLFTSDWKAGLWGIVVQFISDFSVMTGFTSGILRKT